MVAVKTNAATHLGVGLYGLEDAASLLHIRPSTLRAWLTPKHRLVPRTLPLRDRPITFAELMELHFIVMFRNEGVSLQTIRKASKAASAKFHTDYPFSVKRFDTDGRTVFATLIDKEKDDIVVEDLRRGQLVFEKIMKPFFHKLDFHGMQEVARFWPMEKKGRIVLDPERQFGKPIDAETGVPTRAIFNASKAGGGQDSKTVAKWFGIPVQAVQAAVTFETSLVE
jgi:uncharacterized protein (DUF433 family)